MLILQLLAHQVLLMLLVLVLARPGWMRRVTSPRQALLLQTHSPEVPLTLPRLPPCPLQQQGHPKGVLPLLQVVCLLHLACPRLAQAA